MPRQTAANKRNCYIDERQVHWVTAKIIDQNGVPCDTKGFVRELRDLLRLKVMRKQRAADAIDARIRERKLKSIAGNRGNVSTQVRGSSIQQDGAKRYAFRGEHLVSRFCHIARCAGHIKK